MGQGNAKKSCATAAGTEELFAGVIVVSFAEAPAPTARRGASAGVVVDAKQIAIGPLRQRSGVRFRRVFSFDAHFPAVISGSVGIRITPLR